MPTIQEHYHQSYESVDHGAPGSDDQEPTFRLRVAAALQAMPSPRQRVLDYGCGMGGAARVFAEAGHDVVGVDISEPAIRLARSKAPQARFEVIVPDAPLPFADNSFDVVFATEVIEHLFDVSGFLGEMRRVLTNQGLLLLTTPYHGLIKNLVIVTRGFESHFPPDGGHIRFFSRRSLTDSLEKAGFSVEGFQGIGRFWPVWKSMFVAARKRG